MLNVYIKCYSRPAYLDRCIRSVKRMVSGYQAIVLLDDGLEDQHLARILELHPDVQVRRSLKVTCRDGGTAAPDDPRLLDPARFWVQEIGKDSNRFMFLMEEDTWLTKPFDLPLVLRNMERNNALLLRLYWNGNPRFALSEEVILAAILDGGTTLEYYAPKPKHWFDLYRMFSLAQAIYRTDYWVHSYTDIPSWHAEQHVLQRALAFVKAHQDEAPRPRFAKMEHEVVRHCVSSTSRADAGGIGVTCKIDPVPYNAVLNEGWYDGSLDPLEGFPHDFSEAGLMRLFEARLGREAAEAWLAWKRDYLRMYAAMGCALE